MTARLATRVVKLLGMTSMIRDLFFKPIRSFLGDEQAQDVGKKKKWEMRHNKELIKADCLLLGQEKALLTSYSILSLLEIKGIPELDFLFAYLLWGWFSDFQA